MRCPTLNDLPTPPPDKTGWPWTEESPQLPDTMPDGSPWPKISIVTPSLNQGQFIEETIRSVLLQGYPNLEYIIVDGGSTDGTIEIIKKYEKWLTYWVSEPDDGQSHAINKGLRKSTGDIAAWLNSDDVYCENIFSVVSINMWDGRTTRNNVFYGNCLIIDRESNCISIIYGRKAIHVDILKFWKGKFSIPQPALFLSGNLFRDTLLDENLHYVMDWELLVRISKKSDLVYYDYEMAKFREHHESKSIISWKPFMEERRMVLERYFKETDKYYLIIFRAMYIGWMIRYYYHSEVRELIKRILARTLGQRNYSRLKYLKRVIFPLLSKESLFRKR